MSHIWVINRLCQQLMREDPALKIVPFAGLGIEGSKGDSRLLSIAGGNWPHNRR